MRAYRSRIYQYYVNSRETSLSPASLEDFAPRAPTLKKVVREFFPERKDAAVLDLGCGHGALIYFARQAGYTNVRGVDVSGEQVAEARRLGIEGVEEKDLLDTLAAAPDGSIDCVVAFDVIEHFTKDELLEFVDEVYRVLKPNGRWLIHAPNGESPFCSSILYSDFTHELAFTRASLLQLLLSSGFKAVSFNESGPVASGVKGTVRWLLWRVYHMALRFRLAVETGDVGKSAIFTRNLFAKATK
ncbi:MAG: class I SAM-dependent methyltransferase [Sedimenticola sp.]